MEDYKKKYEKALARAGNLMNNSNTPLSEMCNDICIKIFPELEGSEDEKIRKMLIEYFKSLHKTASHTWNIPNDRIIAWLEKQKDGYTKKDIDDTYLRGIADAKSELEKQKQEWSEEDEEMTEDLIKGCLSSEKAYHLAHSSKEIADWLKSLKSKLQR